MKKVAAVFILAALPLSGTYLYIWRNEHFFRNRYEDAYQALGMAALASLGILVVAGAVALLWSAARTMRR